MDTQMGHQQSPHTACTEHALQCKKIADNCDALEELKQEQTRMWEHIRSGVTSRVAFAALSIITTLFLGIFTVSIHINRELIRDYQTGIETREKQMDAVARSHSELLTIVASMRTELATISKQMDEVKMDIRDLKRERTK